MKKTFVFFAFYIVFSGLCFAQNTNNASRIIGSWSRNEFSQSGFSRKIWVFNSNGTVTITTRRLNERGISSSDDSEVYRFVVSDSKLLLLKWESFERNAENEVIYNFYGGNTIMTEEEVYNYSISSDGKYLILEYGSDRYGDLRAYLLTKE
jgi:hypothetical protein